VTITAGRNVFRCTVSQAESSARVIGVFNKSPLTIPAHNTQATISNPGSGTTVEFVVDASAPTDLKCGTDW